MKHKTRKLLSILLALFMFVGILPVNALADNSTPEFATTEIANEETENHRALSGGGDKPGKQISPQDNLELDKDENETAKQTSPQDNLELDKDENEIAKQTSPQDNLEPVTNTTPALE